MIIQVLTMALITCLVAVGAAYLQWYKAHKSFHYIIINTIAALAVEAATFFIMMPALIGE